MLTAESSGAGSRAFAGEKVLKKNQKVKNKKWKTRVESKRRDEMRRGEKAEEDGTQTEPSEPILSLDL